MRIIILASMLCQPMLLGCAHCEPHASWYDFRPIPVLLHPVLLHTAASTPSKSQNAHDQNPVHNEESRSARRSADGGMAIGRIR